MEIKWEYKSPHSSATSSSDFHISKKTKNKKLKNCLESDKCCYHVLKVIPSIYKYRFSVINNKACVYILLY